MKNIVLVLTISTLITNIKRETNLQSVLYI